MISIEKIDVCRGGQFSARADKEEGYFVVNAGDIW